jgi:hypothetical protein
MEITAVKHSATIEMNRFSGLDARMRYNRLFFPVSCKSKRSKITGCSLMALLNEKYEQAKESLRLALDEDLYS